MPSVQKCADQLREQAYKTLTPQIQALEDELRDFNRLLATGIRSIGYKLESLRHTEFPVTESILNNYLQNDLRKRDLEGEALALFTRGLRTKETQEEILASLLDNAANCFPRVALFAIRSDMFKGWSSRGFSDSTAGSISTDEFRKADCSWLMKALRSGDHTEVSDLPDIGSLRLMREESSGVWRVYPLYVLGRPAAVLLAGKAEGFAERPEALAILMDCAALRLENVALKIIKTLNDPSPENAVAAVLPAEPLFSVTSVPPPAPGVSFDVLSLNLTAPIETPEPVRSLGESYYEPDAIPLNPLAELKLVEQPPEPAMEIPAASTSEYTREIAADTEPTTADTPAAAAYEYARETVVETESTAADTPAAEASEYATEDDRLHAAAKRFAELLVSGIKLYNDGVVAEGLKNRDLYKRLQNSMDRNREMYEKRVSPTVAQSIDYLHEEFVRILGDGDAGVFGDGYPGPFVGKTDRITRF